MKVKYNFEYLTHALRITPKNKIQEQELRDFFESKGECKLQFNKDHNFKLRQLTITRVT